MKKVFLLLACFSMAIFSCQAQSVSGTWSGVLKVMGTQLHLVFHIKNSDGTLSATMDSPDQHASDISVSNITFKNPNLHIEVGGGAIVYDGKLMAGDSIEGMFKQSGMELPLTLQKGDYKAKALILPQTPKPPFPYKSIEVTFANPKANIELAGTLTVPDKGTRFPAVVLISGSGPQDRDETILGHKPFWVIADYLSRRGIAVLRVDDRGTAKSQGNFAMATTADFATDVASAVQFLRQRIDINPKKIGLIGHSEGGIIAPMVASQDKNIDFIVLLAGPGYDGADLLVMQNEALGKAAGLSAEQLETAEKINKTIYRMAMRAPNYSVMKEKMTDSLWPLMSANMSRTKFDKFVDETAKEMMSPWMSYFLKNNPQNYLRKVSCPVLALDGTKDLQVPAEKNITAIKKALSEGGNKNVTTRIFPGLNHLFQDAKTGLPSEYGTIKETFSPVALAYMADWIEQQVK